MDKRLIPRTEITAFIFALHAAPAQFPLKSATSLAPGIVLFDQFPAVFQLLFPFNPVQEMPCPVPQEISPAMNHEPAVAVPPLQINFPVAPIVKAELTVRANPAT